MKKKPATKKSITPLQLEELSWKQIDALPRATTIIFIPISPLEEHGPHLPIGTDFLTSRDTAKQAITTLQTQRPELTPILFPPIPLGYTKMSACFPGTIPTRARTIKNILIDTIGSLATYDFQYFLICSYHMDLGHLKGIHTAINRLQKRYPIHITEPWSTYFFSKTMEKQEPDVGFDTSKEVHAGFRETSLMKYQYPYLVDKDHTKLTSIYHDVFSPKCLGKNFKDLGINDGYIGSPAKADSNYGRWFFQETVNIFTQTAQDLIDGKPLPQLPKETKLLMKSLFWI